MLLPKLFLISILSSLISATGFTHSYSQCLDDQKSLLLQLKNELIFDSSFSTKLVRWNQTHDCCKWYGVDCDDAGYVISLQLDFESISGGIGDSSSLFRLKYLEKLNLAFNHFNSTLIPKGIRNLSYLTHLDLSHAGFVGQVPVEITSLKKLVSFDISTDLYLEPLTLGYPNLEMLVQNMTGLRELYLDRVNITSSRERRKWSHIISSNLPHLTTLSCVDCSLSGPFARSFSQLHSLSILRLDRNNLSTTLRLDQNNLSAVVPDLFSNLSSLTTLSLSDCSLKGSFPNMIFQIPTLQNIDLSYNELLSGSLPPFPQNGSLESMVLRMTNFSGLIPRSISNLKTLSKLDFFGCKFIGSIPSTFANLTQLTDVDLSSNLFIGSLSSTLFEGLFNLVYVDLSYNSFSGKIPHSLFGLPSLKRLRLSNNHFTGQVEEFSIVINVSNIGVLDLSRNQLEGPIPHSLFGLPSLWELNLRDNNFTGQVEELSIVINVSNIVGLDLSVNQLEGPIPDSLFQLQSLEYLWLSDNLFSGTFQLEKIQSLASLRVLDLSNNKLSIDVSNHNSTTYGLPQLTELNLASCNMHDFPDFLKHSDMIVSLDLSNNGIGGEIPSWIWRLTQLYTLLLSHNLLTGLQKPYHIPSSLYYLGLSSNHLRGELNLLIPPNITSHLRYLLLSNNSLSGSIPTSLCTVTQPYVVDLSVNKLSGTIPSCLFQNNTRLGVLDLGRNNISGHIPDTFSPHCNLQYFDLNNNTLEGKIPRSLKNCEQLEFMNVGNNIINDTFPCMLPSSLRVLALHSNSFHGEVTCHNSSWPDLQILDISSNHFGGSLETINFSSWRGMVQGSDSQLRHEESVSYHLWSSGITLIMKGLQVELHKIWSDLSSIDLSCNNFRGEIPNEIGDLSLLHQLNLSHNALNGSIPKSLGKLGELEALDLSRNQLTGAIPMELASLTFLSSLNLSYNMLVGEIPNGRQLQTFSGDSFKGNPGLCGFNLDISCSNHTVDESDLSLEKVEEKKREIEWEYVSAALGYVVGLGSIVWLLLFCRSFRKKYFDKIDEVVQQIFDARDMRRRRRATARRRAVKNRDRRQ